MTAQQLVTYLTWAFYLAAFVATVARAVRHPRRATIDPALLLGVLAIIILADALAGLTGLAGEVFSDVIGCLLMVLPYLLFRLVEDFAPVPAWLARGVEAGLVLSIVAIAATHGARALVLTSLLVLYFVLVTGYSAVAFVHATMNAGGVTRRRLLAVAWGAGLLAAALLLIGLEATLPGLAEVWSVLTELAALGSGVGFYLGFATPSWLRRAWQEPELRRFLSAAASLPRLPTTQAIVEALEDGTRRSLGAETAAIGLWDPNQRVLLYSARHTAGAVGFEVGNAAADEGTTAINPEGLLVGRVLASQRTLFTADAIRDNPGARRLYKASGTLALMAAPVTAGSQPLGVLSTHGQATIFMEDDLDLLSLLADQAAVVLESRGLIDEAARVHAREEATKLKDDFLSAAAHDLRTPLTSLIGRAQLLQRRVRRDGGAVDPESIDVIVDQANRLRDLMGELLDANRVERGGLSGVREAASLRDLLLAVCDANPSKLHRVTLECDGPLDGSYDVDRLKQLFRNLLENAVKYSPEGGEIAIKAQLQDGEAYVTVTDSGIGIAASELPRIFDRFQRAANVDDRRFPGMGLGLYICRGIVEEHGGRIWATSQEGKGTTMHVRLPLSSALAVTPA